MRAKHNFFVDVQLWPLRTSIDPDRWLENFTPSEEEYALHLLSAFMYFSDHLVKQLFISAFQSLSLLVIPDQEMAFLQAHAAWRSFVDEMVITYVTGEVPNATDSGYTFARMARQALGIPQERILTPDQALRHLIHDRPRPVVFVDDFLGTGRQCVATWHRSIQVDNTTMSFAQIATIRGTHFYYCPLICTASGRTVVRQQCPDLQVWAPHVLPPTYSALAVDSILWPDHLRSNASEFVHNASKRAGIPENEWEGYQGLGLALAFAHSVPDATLPLFYWETNGWRPLVRRT